MTKPVILPVEPNPVGPKRSEPPNSDNIWRPLGLGFRPFFLLAAIAAALLMVAWLLSWHRAPASAMSYYGHVTWHSHEMLFGYIAAVAAGFLLTAVRNWTGVQTPTGTPLLLLALLWLAGSIGAVNLCQPTGMSWCGSCNPMRPNT